MIANAGNRGEAGASPDRRPVLVVLGAGLAACVTAATYGAFSALLLVVACGATWRFVPLVADFALRHGATVLPGGRSVHARVTPLMGGVAVAVPLLAVLVATGDAHCMALACGCGLVVVSGAVDDLHGLSPARKILLQVLGAGVLHAGGFRIEQLVCPPFAWVVPEAVQPVLLVLWVLLVTNAINLIDGMDGLASGAGLVACVACVSLGYGGIVPLILAGALLGFLRHNLPCAGIFLGDAGSLMLGFVIAALLMDVPRGVNVPVAFGLLALPLGDVALCMARRALRGKPIFSADCGHVHHRLLKAYGRPGPALAVLLAFAAVQALLAVLHPDVYGLAVGCALWIGFAAYVLRGAWSPLRDVFRQRRTYKRLHLLRRYADESLRLAETRPEVEPILERVAEDFGLVSLRLRDVDIVRGIPDEGTLAGETLDCGGSEASWTYVEHARDEVLADEQRAVLCELLRRADSALGRLDGNGRPAPARTEAPSEPRRPRVHFIACGRDDLVRLAPVVASARERGVIHPVIVHTGCRDGLDLGRLPSSLRRTIEPDIDLDVQTDRDALLIAHTMDRYDALLGAVRPAMAVVVGETSPAFACALAAKRRGLPVAHLDGQEPAAASFNGSLTESLADLRVDGADCLESLLGAQPA